MSTLEEIQDNRSTIRLNHMVKSVYLAKVGKVIKICQDNVNTVVKWADGSISQAPIASLIRVFSEKGDISDTSDFDVYRDGDKNPYKNMMDKKKQTYSQDNAKNLFKSKDIKNPGHIIYSNHKGEDGSLVK